MQMQHGGVPAHLVTNRPVGPYRVSLWGMPDVGARMLYVVYDAPPGQPFVAPSAVRLAVAPVSGRLPEVVYVAHPEGVRHGARFVAHVTFDRSEAWRVRILTDGAGGVPVGETVARLDVAPAPTLGPLDFGWFALPFVLVAGVWWRAAVVRRARRRQAASQRLALATH